MTEKKENPLNKLAAEIIESVKVVTMDDTDEILAYSESKGIYVPSENRIRQHLRGRKDMGSHDVNEVVTGITELSRGPNNRSTFDNDPAALHIGNGWLNLSTWKVEPHSPDRRSLTKIPHDFNPNATCPTIMKFLTEVVDNRQLKTIVRLLGYVLLSDNRYEKAFMFVGEGANGKGTLIRLINALVGKSNVSNKSLQELTDNRFAAAELFGKMVNTCADLKADKIFDTGMFKMLVSGDRIDAQRKHQQPFQFENRAKLIFSTNNIPKADDESYAYFRRWVLLFFSRTFEGDSKDEGLYQKMTTKEEMEGLLRVAVIGAKRLVEEHGFEETDVEEVRRQYELGASKIKDFIDKNCILEENVTVSSASLNNAFVEYCKSTGTEYTDIRTLGKHLKSIGIERKQRRVKGTREWAYAGITLRETMDLLATNWKGVTVAPSKHDLMGKNNSYNKGIRCEPGLGDPVTKGGAAE